MASKGGKGSSNNGRDSAGRRLGIKRADGEFVLAGNIIFRQKGTKFYPGAGTGMGTDHTIFAKIDGTVIFFSKGNKKYIGINEITE